MSEQPTKTQTPSEKWMTEGITFHKNYLRTFEISKECALNAGIYFMEARNLCAHGQWEPLVEKYRGQISRTTIYRYIDFSEELLAWAKEAHPELTGVTKLKTAAMNMSMLSPKGYIALNRQLEKMRKFGEYDGVKYRQKKLRGTGQIEFEFVDLFAPLESFSHMGDENFIINFPDGADKKALIQDAKSKLQTALNRLTEMEKTIEI